MERTHRLGFLVLSVWVAVDTLGCHREGSRGAVETPGTTQGPTRDTDGEGTSAEPERTEASPAGEAANAREEPMQLPFDDFWPDVNANPFTYTRTPAPGCNLVYERWWGTPPDPGPPVSQVSVRSARLPDVAAYVLVYDVGDGEERVWRRGDGYQVAITFQGCTPSAVDAILGGTDTLMTRPLGTTMPAAQSVCVGPRNALALHVATPSRAGTYDPSMPIQGEHLNWTVPGVGCVTYPGMSNDAPCGGGSHPWVATTLCQQ